MRKIAAMALILFVVGTMGCRKTGEDQYEVDRPTVGMTTDTINVPDIEIGSEERQVTVPDIDVRRDTATVRVPTIETERK